MLISLSSQKFGFSLPDLYNQVSNQGWEMKKVKYDKESNRTIATAKHPDTGEEINGWGPSPERAVANLALLVAHRNQLRSSKVASWDHSFTDQLIPIAEAYANAAIYEPKAAHAFMELARDSVNRAKAIQEQLTVIFTNQPEPYKSPDKMFDDIRKKRQLVVSRAGADHPLWSLDEVMAYRICHDVLGYAAVNAPFTWEGENQAFAAHASIVPVLAQSALFTESIAQTAYATYYRSYGPQKIALFPQFVDKAIESQNPHAGFRGIHPSQMFLPGQTREAKPPHKSHRIAKGVIKPMADGRLPVDINAGWQSNQPVLQQYDQALQDPLGLNQMEHMISGNGMDPSDPNYVQGLHSDWTHEGPGGAPTGWNAPMRMDEGTVKAEWQKYNEENPQGANMIRQAVANAIRVAALSPRTLLHQNAQQYQDLQGVPFDEKNPNVYWNALENARQNWNAARFGDQNREEHRPWNIVNKAQGQTQSPFISLASTIYDHDRSLGQAGAKTEATSMINEMKTRFHDYLMKKQDIEGEESGDDDTPQDQRMWIVDNEANKMVLKWIKLFTDPSSQHDEYQPSEDEMAGQIERTAAEALPGMEPEVKWPNAVPRSKPLALDDPQRLEHFQYGPEYEGYENHKINNLQRYGAFMGTSIQTIARLTQHLDDIVVAALEDIHAHDGTGHHFRTFMLSLNAPGIGPKVISFMWLLLQPLTSQLATIDVHMAHVLGYTEKDVTDRDYFRMERELASQRDAMGLNHVPLGQFQWATWDQGRTGEGTEDQGVPHQDHSFMRPVDPTPAWKVKVLPAPAERNYAPPLMEQFRPAQQQVVSDWEDNEGRQFPAGAIPTQAEWPNQMPQFMSKISSTPWFTHPKTGEKFYGQDGQTLMQYLKTFGLSVGDAWNQIPDEAAGKLP